MEGKQPEKAISLENPEVTAAKRKNDSPEVFKKGKVLADRGSQGTKEPQTMQKVCDNDGTSNNKDKENLRHVTRRLLDQFLKMI
jgi:hypothetical protein